MQEQRRRTRLWCGKQTSQSVSIFGRLSSCHAPIASDMITIMSNPIVTALFELAGRERQLAEGSVLFRAGDPVRTLFVVKTGTLRLTRSLPHGSQLVLQNAGPGAIL